MQADLIELVDILGYTREREKGGREEGREGEEGGKETGGGQDHLLKGNIAQCS